MLHFPVLLEESVDFLVNDINGHYIDCTFGRGGHSELILNKISNKGFLSSFDKDPEAYKHGLNLDKKNFEIHHDSFQNIGKYFKKESIDGIIYDLGTCSTHFDNPKRGFSFNKEGPLDMRFNNTTGMPFSKWLEDAKKNDISEVLYKFGDEKHAKLIANAIYAAKNEHSISNTLELAKIIKDVYPEKYNKIHPATKSFQAFRILINNELDELKRSLENAEEIIKRNGFIVTIAFHSLEDNIVKNFFRPSIKSFPKDIPINNEEKRKFKCIAKKIRASEAEVNINPRSRSAIMRVFQKT
tara:strand:+ start:1733 stop:2626 length:894 start_codon:yes stop_codon:yes gene_type:complete